MLVVGRHPYSAHERPPCPPRPRRRPPSLAADRLLPASAGDPALPLARPLVFAIVFAMIAVWVVALVLGRLSRGLHRFLPSTSATRRTCSPTSSSPRTPTRVHRDTRLSGRLSCRSRSARRAGRSRFGSSSRSRRSFSLHARLSAEAVAAAAATRRPANRPSAMRRGVLGVAAACAFLGWFAVARARADADRTAGPRAYAVGYGAQTYSYFLLLTDRYPNSDPEASARRGSSRRIRCGSRYGRRTALAADRLLPPPARDPPPRLAAPLERPAFFAAFANGRRARPRALGRAAAPLPRGVHPLLAHLTAFLLLAANPFPGFTGRPAIRWTF